MPFDEVDEARFTAARQRLGAARARRPRLWLACWGAEGPLAMAAVAATMPAERTTVAGAFALVEPLRAALPPATALMIDRPAHRGHPLHPIVTIETGEPAAALRALDAYARSIDARLNLWAAELDPLAMALDRVVASARR